jgi:hypothetical protein
VAAQIKEWVAKSYPKVPYDRNLFLLWCGFRHLYKNKCPHLHTPGFAAPQRELVVSNEGLEHTVLLFRELEYDQIECAPALFLDLGGH